MESISSSISEWILVLTIISIFYLLRRHLFNKYRFIDYFLMAVSLMTFGVGCFFLGRDAKEFGFNVSLCAYHGKPFWCYTGNYLSISPAVILIIVGLLYLFMYIESSTPHE